VGLRIDERELLLHSGVGEQIATLLGQAIEQHKDTGRGASVVLAITVRTDAKTGKTHARGQVKATIPDGDNNMTVTKLPSQGLLTITNDHPGQQTLDDLAKPTPAKRLKQAKASIRKAKKPKAQKAATAVVREINTGTDDDGQPAKVALPPGVYEDRDSDGTRYALISSEPMPPEVREGARLSTSYGTGGIITSISEYRDGKGMLQFSISYRGDTKHGGGHVNECVVFNGQMRMHYANNTDRWSVDGVRPAEGVDDSAELLKSATPLAKAG
jgi:hypothetical protein